MKSNNKPLIRQVLLIALFIAGAVYGVRAQSAPKPSPTPTPNPCPMLSVSSPDSVAVNSPITFSIDVSGGDADVTPTFNWNISAGKIESGQGTSSITVDTTGLKGGESVTATVDIGGYNRSCPSSNSSTTQIAKKP